jgi:hypothetical protein
MVDMNPKSINNLVAEFAAGVVKQNEAIRRRDPVTGNRYAESYVSAFKELHGMGDAALAALASLLEDERIEVRAMTAAFLIPYMTDEAVMVLKTAAEGHDIVALGAQVALSRWQDEGRGIEFE